MTDVSCAQHMGREQTKHRRSSLIVQSDSEEKETAESRDDQTKAVLIRGRDAILLEISGNGIHLRSKVHYVGQADRPFWVFGPVDKVRVGDRFTRLFANEFPSF